MISWGADRRRGAPGRGAASYLITGGLGALGLEVARWLVGQGAGRLVLSGRRGAERPEQQAAVSALRESGAEVLVVAADVSQREDAQRLLEQAEQPGFPLRGIIHAAGVLDDGMLRQQTWSRFQQVMAPKVAGAWNLHLLTRGRELDFFVCFSSAAALLGSPGQGNYAAANAFLDGLAQGPRAGLPALSINWGPWEGIGMAARLDDRNRARLAEAGLENIDVPTGVRILAKLLNGEGPQVAVLPVDWSRFTLGGRKPPLWRNLAKAPPHLRPNERNS